MNTMTMMDTGTHFRAARPAPLAVFQKIVTAGPRTMGQAIQAAIDGIADGSLKPLSPNAASPLAQTRAVLALLADCYARQIYRSTDAANLAARDPEFPWPWWEELPDARALRRVRAENREAIQRCLVVALRFLVEQKILAGVVTRVNGSQLAEEARRRIIMAAFADSMELDGETGADDPPAEISFLFANLRGPAH
jgi:hypothetical protein